MNVKCFKTFPRKSVDLIYLIYPLTKDMKEYIILTIKNTDKGVRDPYKDFRLLFFLWPTGRRQAG